MRCELWCMQDMPGINWLTKYEALANEDNHSFARGPKAADGTKTTQKLFQMPSCSREQVSVGGARFLQQTCRNLVTLQQLSSSCLCVVASFSLGRYALSI